jgi:hypothetical protein
MRQCQPAKDRAAGRSQADPNFALVVGAASPRDGARGLQAIHQFHRAVMLQEETRGNLPNGGPYTLGKTLHGQQELMLLRLDAMLLRGSFTEMQKLPDLAAELGEIAVLIGGKVCVNCSHLYRNAI